MFNVFKGALLALVREKSVFIWSLAFPLILSTMFVFMFANLDEAGALKTFNRGLGMVRSVDAARADEVEAARTRAGETTYRVGRIVAGEGEVRYANDGKLYGFGAEA